MWFETFLSYIQSPDPPPSRPSLADDPPPFNLDTLVSAANTRIALSIAASVSKHLREFELTRPQRPSWHGGIIVDNRDWSITPGSITGSPTEQVLVIGFPNDPFVRVHKDVFNRSVLEIHFRRILRAWLRSKPFPQFVYSPEPSVQTLVW